MKLSMIAIGSRGDVQPIVALAYLRVQYIALSKKVAGAYPLPLFPIQFSLGRWYNRLTYSLAWHPLCKSINQFRHSPFYRLSGL